MVIKLRLNEIKIDRFIPEIYKNMNKKQRITVLGGGNDAFAAAAGLTINKHMDKLLF